MPSHLRQRINLVRHALRATKSRTAFHPRRCNICGYEGYFGAAGLPIRHEARCPSCKSLERHRLFKLWLDSRSDDIKGRHVLHFAPESAVARLVKPLAGVYQTADLAAGIADLRLNIEHIDLKDGSVDVVICFHVLEHVDDDLALSEMARILTPGGLLLLMTPIVEGWATTYENPEVSSASDRELHFGQWDHVRYFGADVRDGMKRHFTVTEFTAVEPFVMRHGLMRGEKLFVCRKG